MNKSNVLAVNGQVLPREQRPRGFAQIPNAILLDERLSFKARGILSLLISRPPGWQVYVKELTKRSSKDGLRAVQSGLKELAKCGYIHLLPIYNNETGRFEGSFYKLKEEIFLTGQAHFRPAQKNDDPKNRQSPVKLAKKVDHPKSCLLSNTDSSNTETNNTKKQQQQTTQAAAVDRKDILFFSKALHEDQEWQACFLQQQSLEGNVPLLSKSDIMVLLLHFQQTSLQQGCMYPDLEAVKRHFANWFNANQTKGALVTFIQEFGRRKNRSKTQSTSLLKKASLLFQRIQDRQCTNIAEVLQTKKALLQSQHMLAKLLPYLQFDQEIYSAVTTARDNIEALVQQIERGAKANRLDWYCQST